MRNWQQLKPFISTRPASQSVQGGSRAGVQNASDAIRENSQLSLAARIYAPTAVKAFDQDDPRYAGKSDNVENIYLPAQESPAPRSGVAQILSWLTTGVLK